MASSRVVLLRAGRALTGQDRILQEKTFHAMLTLERRRAERSRKPFVLMLLDSGAAHPNGHRPAFVERLTSLVCDATRETDLIGWYESGSVLAVIFTEISFDGENPPVTQILHSKIVKTLQENLDPKLASKLHITFHLFPEDWQDREPSDRVADSKLYPELSRRAAKKHLPMAIKRGIDILGSALLLLFLSPVFGVIALAIKLTSKGPVIFRQDRLGQFGKRFECLKFRTMYVDNNHHIHREYVQKFIAGKTGNIAADENEPAVFKIKNDPRVTRIGRFLRKTSLDEFPQFWNVLRGEMSLVGPRPPVPYEFEVYDFWHRRRVLEVKPGVTGLWQVTGRSRTCFDDMVRLDLRYSQTWSIWLDLRILLATPRAVLMGDGAF
ncbi:MAG TPA: sugar transferase [Candidatus Acidoferrales bacterium]|nr:sugar transferase [Candidatus Acidoferrales bacterium]